MRGLEELPHKNMNHLRQSIAAVAALLLFPSLSHATVWEYNWTTSDPLFGNNDGGIWRSVHFDQDDNTGLFNASISLDTATNNTSALWLSVTNGPTPSTASANYAGVYLIDGNLFVRPYSDNPTSDHELTNVITTGGYSVSTLGTVKTFSFSLDTNTINSWSGGGVGWLGFGFPYDAQHNTNGDPFSPYRIGAWVRSFADNSVALNASVSVGSAGTWDVTWGQPEDPNIGTWDIGNAPVSPVPEPSSALLAGLAGMIFVSARRFKRLR